MRKAVIDMAKAYGHYGYQRVGAMLRRDGWLVNDKRVYRIWRGEGALLHKGV